MGKICAVVDCPSGHRADKLRRQRAGIPQVSLFSVPKQSDMLAKWRAGLGSDISSKDAVCELHFPSHCIMKEYVTEMPDGTLHRMPRDRHDLIKDAVPIRSIKQRDKDVSTVGVVPKTNKNLSKSSIDGNKRMRSCVIADESWSTGLPTTNEKIAVSAPTKIPSHERKRKSSARLEKCTKSSIQDVAVPLRGDCSNCNKVLDNSSAADDDQRASETGPFSFNDVVQYFAETPLRQSWCWMLNSNENCLKLIHLDTSTLKIKVIMKFHHDLSVTIHTGDNMVSVELNGIVTSEEKIEQLLHTIENKIVVCRGTGVENRSRADDCFGFMSTKDFKQFEPVPRCDACERLGKMLHIKYCKRWATDRRLPQAQSRDGTQLKRRTAGPSRRKVDCSSTRRS